MAVLAGLLGIGIAVYWLRCRAARKALKELQARREYQEWVDNWRGG